MSPDLIYLHGDDPAVPATISRLARTHRIEVRHWSDGAIDAGSAAVIVDVDLADSVVVAAVRRMLDRAGVECRVFAIDPDHRAQRIQAGVLGATEIVARPIDVDGLAERLARPGGGLPAGMGRREVPLDAPGAASILAAGHALDDLFTACIGGGTVAGERIGRAGAEVAGSIREIGLDVWMETVRHHHGGTYQHCLLVTGFAAGFGAALGLSERDTERLALAGLAHDVGKARVPVALLDKPGRLDAGEFAVMKIHPEAGFAFLSETDATIDPVVLDAVVHHHEMLDGSGYPHGLMGNEIGDLTRIMTVCDIYGALAERRAYKPALGHGDMMRILDSMAATGKLEKALVRVVEAVVHGDGARSRPVPRRRGSSAGAAAAQNRPMAPS